MDACRDSLSFCFRVFAWARACRSARSRRRQGGADFYYSRQRIASASPRRLPRCLCPRLVRTFWLVFALPLAGLAADGAAERVLQWSRFELAIRHAFSAADPYRDVTLEVVYTSPEGRSISFWGFYDGGGTWRARFMPDVKGTWRYEAKLMETTRTDPSGSATTTRPAATK